MPQIRSVLKRLHAALPFKQPVYKVLRWLGPPPERMYRHLHFKGVIEVNVSRTEKFLMQHHGYMIENELFWKGFDGWEQVSMRLWTRLSKRSNVIMDIGANTGVYALTASVVNPRAKVIAVEPVDRVFRKLEANIRLNGNHVHAVRAAATERSGTAILYDLPESEHVFSVSLDPDWNKGDDRLRPVEVPALTVADILARQEAPRVDLLKIDVESHEAAVLRGFKDVLNRDRPSLLMELVEPKVAEEVADLIGMLGYEYYNIDEVTWPPKRLDSLSISSHYNILICSPEVARAIGL